MNYWWKKPGKFDYLCFFLIWLLSKLALLIVKRFERFFRKKYWSLLFIQTVLKQNIRPRYFLCLWFFLDFIPFLKNSWHCKIGSNSFEKNYIALISKEQAFWRYKNHWCKCCRKNVENFHLLLFASIFQF